jgi:hypothetical protein
MKQEQDYLRDIAEVRSLMERSTRFLSLSGLAGVMAGIYALAGVFIVWKAIGFEPTEDVVVAETFSMQHVVLVALGVLILSIGTALLLSSATARKRNESIWNPVAKRVAAHFGLPLITGGLLMLIFLSQDMTRLLIPSSLIFYGIALFSAGPFTFREIKTLGIIQIALGLFSAYAVEYSLLCWAAGFGIAHMIYGIYLHLRYKQ